MKRFGSAAWNGGLREGKGSVSTESRALETYPYTFLSRYGEKPGTNPEELLGAAHATCFTMSFVRLLGMANFVPEQVDSKSEVVIDKDGDGYLVVGRRVGEQAALLVKDELLTPSSMRFWRARPSSLRRSRRATPYFAARRNATIVTATAAPAKIRCSQILPRAISARPQI
jgi:osmotically inducible protein OsmC